MKNQRANQARSSSARAPAERFAPGGARAEQAVRTSAIVRVRDPRVDAEPHAQARRQPSVDRALVIALLEQRRYDDLLAVLRLARKRAPHDLEILRSLRILELHLGVPDAG